MTKTCLHFRYYCIRLYLVGTTESVITKVWKPSECHSFGGGEGEREEEEEEEEESGATTIEW